MKNKITKQPPKERRRINYGRFLYTGFLCFTMIFAFSTQAFAAPTVWEKANEIFNPFVGRYFVDDVYGIVRQPQERGGR